MSLFVYMVILFIIFIIQFSVSCAALGTSVETEKALVEDVSDVSQESKERDKAMVDELM